jgi:hypothetical protein
VWGSGGIAPVILNLSTRWRYVVSFIVLLLYPQDESQWTVSDPDGTEKRTFCIIECAGPLCVVCLKQHPVIDDLFFVWLSTSCGSSLPQVCAARFLTVELSTVSFYYLLENELVIASSHDSVFKMHCAILAFQVLFFFFCYLKLYLSVHTGSSIPPLITPL